MGLEEGPRQWIVGGVDTHKDLHVAAVVDACDRVLATRSFAATRQGYRQMLAWMQAFGTVRRIGVESTGSYGAGLLPSCSGPGSRSWKSRPRTGRTGAGAARTTILMRKTPRMRLSPLGGIAMKNAKTGDVLQA